MIVMSLLALNVTAWEKKDWIPRLIENTRYCNDDCRLTLTFCNPTTDDILVTADKIRYRVKNLKTFVDESLSWNVRSKEIVTPVYGLKEHSYTCSYDFNYTPTFDYFWCYYYEPTNGSNIVVFEHSVEWWDLPTKTAYWNEYEIINYQTDVKEWLSGHGDSVSRLVLERNGKLFNPLGKTWGAEKCFNITIRGVLKRGEKVDVIPEGWGGFTYDEYAVWESSEWQYIATPNVSSWKLPVNNSAQLLWLKGCINDDAENLTCSSEHESNASAVRNFCSELMNASSDCSDIEIFDNNSDTTVPFITLINITGASWIGNQTGAWSDELLWDAIYIPAPYWNLSTNFSSNIKVSTNGIFTSNTNNDSDANLVGWWVFESGLDNAHLKDFSNYGNDVTVTNAVYLQDSSCEHGSGQFSLGCFDGDGDGDELSVDDPNVLEFGNNPYTIEVWYDADSTGDIILGKRTDTDDDFFQLYINNVSSVQWYHSVTGNQDVVTCNQGTSTGLHHFVVKRTGNNCSAFNNGVYCGEATCDGSMLDDTDNWVFLGVDGHTADFDGRIMSVRIWNESKSDDVILGLYNEGKHRTNWWNVTAIPPPPPPPPDAPICTLEEINLNHKRTYWHCIIPDNSSCVSYIIAENQTIQVNPKFDVIDEYGIVKYFEPLGNCSAKCPVTVYFENKHILPDLNYTYGVMCGNYSANFSKTPYYGDVEEIAYRTVWMKENMTYFVALLVLVVFILVGTYVFRKGGKGNE